MTKAQYRELIYKAIITYEALKETGHMDFTELWYLILAKTNDVINIEDLPSSDVKRQLGDLRRPKVVKMLDAGYIKRVGKKGKRNGLTFTFTTAGQDRLNELMDYIYSTASNFKKLPSGEQIGLAKKTLGKKLTTYKKYVCLKPVSEDIKNNLLKVLNENDWNVRKTCRDFGWGDDRLRLYRKIWHYGIKRGDKI